MTDTIHAVEYEAPTVTVLGTLVELTQHDGCEPGDDNCGEGSI